jgi:hypothetical protein
MCQTLEMCIARLMHSPAQHAMYTTQPLRVYQRPAIHPRTCTYLCFSAAQTLNDDIRSLPNLKEAPTTASRSAQAQSTKSISHAPVSPLQNALAPSPVSPATQGATHMSFAAPREQTGSSSGQGSTVSSAGLGSGRPSQLSWLVDTQSTL